MSLGFALIGDLPFWLTREEGYWGTDRRWVSGYATPQEFTGMWEPYLSGQTNIVLPSGVKSSESITLFTNLELKTHKDLEGANTVSDLIYLQDPDSNPNAEAYVCWDKAIFESVGGFSLITDTFGEYLLVRREKLQEG